MPRVVLHIDELVLTGVEPGERYRILDAVRNALAGSIENGALRLPFGAAPREIESLATRPFEWSQRNDTAQLGSRVADAVITGMREKLAGPKGRGG